MMTAMASTQDGAPFDGYGDWPAVAAADRRARALRARRRPAAGSAPIACSDGSGRQPRRTAAGADLGQRRYPGTGIVSRPALRQRDAAGVGACRAYQAACGRSATMRCSTCRRRPSNRYVKNTPPPAPIVWRIDVEDQIASRQAVSCGWNFSNRRGYIGRPTIGTEVLDSTAVATGLGTYVFDLPTDGLMAKARFASPCSGQQQNRWEGSDFQVAIVSAA